MTQDEIRELFRHVGLGMLLTAHNVDASVNQFVKLVEKRKCEELAKEIEKMPFGDTSQSFAQWVRSQA
jgi:uncharacterized protein Yka (UPF0111/DUF47 family)